MKALLTFLLVLPASVALALPGVSSSEIQSAKIIQTVDPIFPHELLATYRHGGQATILISVSAEGRLSDWLTIRHTDPLFARNALTAIKEWRLSRRASAARRSRSASS